MSVLDNIQTIDAAFSSKGGGDKTPLTDEELRLGREVSVLVFRASNQTDVEGEPISDERVNQTSAEVVAAYVEVNKEAESDWGIQRWCRTVLQKVHDAVKAAGTTDNKRYYGSFNRMLREGCISEKLLTKEEAKKYFPTPGYKSKADRQREEAEKRA